MSLMLNLKLLLEEASNPVNPYIIIPLFKSENYSGMSEISSQSLERKSPSGVFQTSPDLPTF